MAKSNVIFTLVSRRSRLDAQLTALQSKANQTSLDIAAIDRAILVFDPDYKLSTIKPRKTYVANTYFARCELDRLIKEVLREHSPLTVVEIVGHLMTIKKLSLEGKDLAKVKGMVATVLTRQHKKGVIKQVDSVGLAKVWEVA